MNINNDQSITNKCWDENSKIYLYMINICNLKSFIKIKMILQILGTFIILLIAYLFRTLYLLPKRTIQNYARAIRERGYKVKTFAFHPFNNHIDYLIGKPAKEGDALKVMRDQYPQYDAIVSNVMNNVIVQFSHPDFIKDFYSVDKHYSYPKNKTQIAVLVRIVGSGLALSQGEEWKKKRKVFNAVFNFDFIKAQTAKIAEICDLSMERMEKLAQKNGRSQGKNTQYNILDLTGDIFSRVILSNFLGMETQQTIQGFPVAIYLKRLIDNAFDFQDLLGLTLGQKFLNLGLRKKDRQRNRRIRIYMGWALEYIRQKVKKTEEQLGKNINKKEPSDLIQALLMYKKKNDSKQNQSISSEKQILEEFNTFFFAGTDTTSNYTQMMIYYIALNRQVERKLRLEIDEFMKENDYSYENLKNLKYIDNIQKQTTRMYGPALMPFIRTPHQDNYLNGIPIKKGTLVIIMQHSNHYSEKYFKDPLEFRPERWDSQCQNLPPFIFGGFSFGARTCIGKHLALLENKVAIVKFMKRYQKIILPKTDIKMDYKFLPCPQTFNTKLVISQ